MRWDRSVASVLLRLVGRGLLRLQADAATDHGYKKDKSHSVSNSEGIFSERTIVRE